MKITDVKTAEVRGHGYSLFVKMFTAEGPVGVASASTAVTALRGWWRIWGG